MKRVRFYFAEWYCLMERACIYKGSLTVSFGLGICGELCWFYYDLNPMCAGLGDGRHFQRFWLVVSIVIIVIISDVVSIVMDCNRRREARLYIGMPSEEKRTRKGLHLDFHLILLSEP